MDRVEVVELAPMRVVSAYGFGPDPENRAWALLDRFLARSPVESAGGAGRYFGFNNPNPAPGSPNYGYEQWVTVPDGYSLQAEHEEGIVIKAFGGGAYACYEVAGIPNPTKWAVLVAWIEGSGYAYDASRQWLEECVNPETLRRNPPDEAAVIFRLLSPVVPVTARAERGKTR